MRNGVSAKCPKGTYSAAFNNASSCSACGTGLTTAGEGSSAATACGLAVRGRYLDPVTKQAVLCPLVSRCGGARACAGLPARRVCLHAACLRFIRHADALPCCCAAWPWPAQNTYSDEETDSTTCKPCPNGWRTQNEGSEGIDSCVAPPGFELQTGATNISLCAVGWHKEGWNRNPCMLVSMAAGGALTCQQASVLACLLCRSRCTVARH